jgi:2'-5' RNA ligase
VDFPEGSIWPTWQRDYRYGALVIEPPRELASILDPIRLRMDPESAGRVGAHITLTPPFAAVPNSADEERVASAIRGVASMRLQLDRPTQFSGSSVIYLPVVPRQGFDGLRAVLLATGLFRLDLPHKDDFVPHLTLSEFGTAPMAALGDDVPRPEAMSFLVEAVAWIVPDEVFHFTVRRTFPLDFGGGRPDREDE